MDPSDIVALGTVGKPHGLRGSFFWEGRTDLLDLSLFGHCLIKSPARKTVTQDDGYRSASPSVQGQVHLAKGHREHSGKKMGHQKRVSLERYCAPAERTPRWQPVTILECRWQGDFIVGRLHLAQTREQIEEWRGATIAIPSARLVSNPTRGVVYWADLLGRQVFSEDGRDLGVLGSFYNAGASDIAVIEAKDHILELPLVSDFVDLTQLSSGARPLAPGEPIAPKLIQVKRTYEQLEPLMTPVKTQNNFEKKPDQNGEDP